MSPSDQATAAFTILNPPSFCQYAGGPCDQDFSATQKRHALFLYPSEPQIIAATIEASISQLRLARPDRSWLTWKALGISGQIVFCQICKALRFSSFVVADVTTLNFNLLFENLVAPVRAGAAAQNARCAFVAGLGMAASKHVLMLQETDVPQPIDYRDVARSYTDATKVSEMLLPLIREVVETLQESRFVPTALPLRPLEKLDLGDLAAENEIKALKSYFVPTGQYNEAKRGHARLVVGRKGTGKTAIFYAVRSAYKPSKSHLVLDLKPEGHQFIKLRESVLQELSPGVQQQCPDSVLELPFAR